MVRIMTQDQKDRKNAKSRAWARQLGKKLKETRDFLGPPSPYEFIDRSKLSGWIRYMVSRKEYFRQLSGLEPTKENIIEYFMEEINDR